MAASSCFSTLSSSIAATTGAAAPQKTTTFLPCVSRLSFLSVDSKCGFLHASFHGRKFIRNGEKTILAAHAEFVDEAVDSSAEDASDSDNVNEGAKLYVGNLPWSCNSADLAEAFQEAGGVEIAEVFYDQISGRSRGFGFVTMSSVSAANAAIERFNGAEFDGRTLRVNFPMKSRNDGFNDGSRSPPRPRFSGNNENKLFVGNLSWNVNDDLLVDIFAEHGTVVDAKVVNDRETGRSRGFGFVTMSSQDEANEAQSKLDGVDVEGRNLRVSLAADRSNSRGGY